MKIYLAGPEVFLPDPVATGKSLKAICTSNGAQGLFPMDNEIPAHILSPPSQPPPATATTSSPQESKSKKVSIAAWIRSANMDMIRDSDAIVANMTPFRGPSMDPGTAYEMGVAAALGKVVVGYTTDKRAYVQKVVEGGHIDKDEDGKAVRGKDGRLRDGEGWAVEEFEGEALVDNLMMACGVDNLRDDGCMCSSFEEAVEMAVKTLKDREVMKS